MNFNSLTNEILQRIIDHCHTGDGAYVARVTAESGVVPKKSKLGLVKKRKGVPESSSYDEWWGRSCSAISMVNKNLRSMAIKHIFTASIAFLSSYRSRSQFSFPQTLRLSKDQDDIFQYSILGSPVSDCITTIIFDGVSRNQETLLFAFVCRTLPLLPNLHTITGFKSQFSRQLSLNSMPSLATSSIKGKRAFDSLTRIATQIKIWEITLEPWVAELLLSKNYDRIESLTLQSPKNAGFVILESNESQFLSLLSNCSNLRNLSIRQTHHFTGHPTSQNVDPVADFVLSTSFSFANTLRSLSLDSERFDGRTTANEFEFIALFPSLVSLKLTFRSSNLDEIESKSFLLPKLISLEVVNCPFLHTHVLIRCLDLPCISTIHLAQTGVRNNEVSPEEEIDEMRKLASELGTYSASLHVLRLTSSMVSSEAVEELSNLQGRATVEVNSTSVVRSNDISIRAELRSHGFISLDDSDSEYSEDEIDCGILETSDSAHSRQVDFGNDLGSTQELLEWAHDRFKMCRDVDVAGVEELTRVLEPVKELREWLED
ncbi:hypothetical protein JCM5353_000441 [Sporobolomyces roseus]